MSTPFKPYPTVADLPPRASERVKAAWRAADISSFEDWFNFGLKGGIGPFIYGLGRTIREEALNDDRDAIKRSFRWYSGGFKGKAAIDAGINEWRSQAYTGGNTSGKFKTQTTDFDGFSPDPNDSPEKKKEAVKSWLSDKGFVLEGHKVRKVNHRDGFVELFGADAHDPAGRWDCSSIGGKWFCYFTADEYNAQKQKLKAQTDKYVNAILDNSSVGWGGNITDADKTRKQEADLKKKNAQAEKNFNDRYGIKKELADPKDILKVRNLNAQAALILGMPKMRQVNGTNLLREVKSNIASTPGEAGKVMDRLNTCSLINYDGSPEALVNILANPHDVRSFLCASPAELSHLQPVLDFYIEHKDDKSPTGVMHERICFSDHTLGDQVVQLAKARRSKKQIADKILNTRGTVGTNVGIKSFDWVFNNKHQGDKTLKASITLHFSNVTELLNEKYLNLVFAARPHPQSRVTKEEEVNSLYRKADQRVKFMKSGDFSKVIPPGENPTAIEDIPTSGPVSQDAPRLKVLVGWADPPPSPYSSLKGEAYRNFHTAVEYTKRIVILKCHQYNLDFQQNGSVNLNLDYIGGIDAFLSDPDTSNVFDMVPMKSDEIMSRRVFINIFEDPDPEDTGDPGALLERSYLASAWEKGYLHRQAKDESNRIQTADGATRIGVSKAGLLYELKTLKMFKRYYQKVAISSSDKKIRELSKYEDVLKAALNEVDHIHEDLIYSSMMDYLSTSGKVYYATVRKRYITGVDDITNIDLSNKVGRRLVLGTGSKPGLNIQFKGTAAAGAISRLRDRWNKAAAGARKNQVEKGTAEKESADLFLDPTSDDCVDNELEPNRINLFYIRLGDLIDLLLCGMKDKPNSEMILGSFYPSLVGIPNTKDSDLYALADLPISMDYFGHWFLTNFVAIRKKPKVSFRRFMDNLLMDLVAPLFNGVLYDKTSAANRGRFTFTFSSIATPVVLPRSADVTGTGDKIPRIINEDDLREASREAGRGALTDPEAQRSYFLAYVKQMDQKLCGDPVKDYERGIVHLMIGTDRGIVKNFKFSQQQNQYFQAAKIEEGNQAGGLFLPQNATLTCVGSTFFRNGQKIYINADFGMGNAAAQLGIGGYYTIVAVENIIEPGKFESTLQCTFTKPKWSGCEATPKRAPVESED